MKALKTVRVLEYIANKYRTGEIVSTEWIEEGCPNKFCCMCLEADDLQNVRQKMAGDHNRSHALEDYDIILPSSYLCFFFLIPHFLLHLFLFLIYILIITISCLSSSSLSPFVSFFYLLPVPLPPTFSLFI